jgi:hypothetical protein
MMVPQAMGRKKSAFIPFFSLFPYHLLLLSSLSSLFTFYEVSHGG